MAMPPPNPPREKPVDLPAFVDALRDELAILERSLAGYTQLSRVYDQHVNGVPEGARKLGIPQFHHKGSLDGRNVVECTPELSKAPPDCVPAVLSVFCTIHATDVMSALGNMQGLVNQLMTTVQRAFHAQTGQPEVQPPLPVPAAEDDEDFDDIPTSEEEDEEAVPPPPREATSRVRRHGRRRAQG